MAVLLREGVPSSQSLVTSVVGAKSRKVVDRAAMLSNDVGRS